MIQAKKKKSMIASVKLTEKSVVRRRKRFPRNEKCFKDTRFAVTWNLALSDDDNLTQIFVVYAWFRRDFFIEMCTNLHFYN